MNRTLSLVLTFKNEEGKNVSMSVKPIDGGIEDSKVRTLMDTIIEQNCFLTSGGDIVSKVKAEIVDRTVDELQVL